RYGLKDRHWLIQHALVITQQQAERYAALGCDLTTSMAFSWGKGDLWGERIGRHVWRDQVPLKRLLRAGLSKLEDLPTTKVLLTMLGGRTIHDTAAVVIREAWGGQADITAGLRRCHDQVARITGDRAGASHCCAAAVAGGHCRSFP